MTSYLSNINILISEFTIVTPANIISKFKIKSSWITIFLILLNIFLPSCVIIRLKK